jgi:hypothetical protein
MADITMCRGEGCPLAKDCRRATARANPHRQAYFTEVPYVEGGCDMYWGDQAEMIMKQLKEITNEKGAREESTNI